MQVHDNGTTANGGVDTSQSQTFHINITKLHLWHNTSKKEDVTDDTQIAPNDLTAVILYLNGYGASDVPKLGTTVNGKTVDSGAPFGIIPYSLWNDRDLSCR